MILLWADFNVLHQRINNCKKNFCFDYTNLFSSDDYQKNDKIIHKYFKDKYGKRRRKPKKTDKKIDFRVKK